MSLKKPMYFKKPLRPPTTIVELSEELSEVYQCYVRIGRFLYKVYIEPEEFGYPNSLGFIPIICNEQMKPRSVDSKAPRIEFSHIKAENIEAYTILSVYNE